MKYLPHIRCVLEYTLVVDLLTSRIIGKARLVLGNSFFTVLYLGGNRTIDIYMSLRRYIVFNRGQDLMSST